MGSEVTISQANGAVSALIDSPYSNAFLIEVCANSALTGDPNDCLISSQLTVVVANPCSITDRKTLPTFDETNNFEDYIFNET